MTSTRSAIATSLSSDRRGFLSQLAALPLIGGGLSLIGRPTSVAQPVTFELMQAYKTWLHYEHRSLAWEMANHPRMIEWYGGRREDRFDAIEPLIVHIGTGQASSFHRYDGSDPASGRAALVLSAVGCDWLDNHRQRRRA